MYSVRTQLWPLPVAGIVSAVLAGACVPILDARIHEGLPSWVTVALFGGDGGAARSLLDAIAGSRITVTSLTFSLSRTQ